MNRKFNRAITFFKWILCLFSDDDLRSWFQRQFSNQDFLMLVNRMFTLENEMHHHFEETKKALVATEEDIIKFREVIICRRGDPACNKEK